MCALDLKDLVVSQSAGMKLVAHATKETNEPKPLFIFRRLWSHKTADMQSELVLRQKNGSVSQTKDTTKQSYPVQICLPGKT
jgi:hypothetical protein